MRTTLGAALTAAAVLTLAAGAASLGSSGPVAAAPPALSQGYYPTYPGPMLMAGPSSYPVMPAPMAMRLPATSSSSYPITPVQMPAVASAGSAAEAAAAHVSIANFAFSPASLTVHVGDTVTWSNNDSVSHTTTSDTGIWDSGPLRPGASFSFTFTSAGTFGYHCMIHPFMVGAVVVQPAAAAPSPAQTQSPSPTPTAAVPTLMQPAGTQVTYAAGWNLVSGPTGAAITGSDGPLYAFRAGDTNYETVAPGTPLVAGAGYWAFFDTPMNEMLPAGGTQPLSVPLPAGQFVLVGNPGSTPATLSGADAAFSYDPVKGYQATTVLLPGQGAWAFSAAGGVLMIGTSQ